MSYIKICLLGNQQDIFGQLVPQHFLLRITFRIFKLKKTLTTLQFPIFTNDATGKSSSKNTCPGHPSLMAESILLIIKLGFLLSSVIRVISIFINLKLVKNSLYVFLMRVGAVLLIVSSELITKSGTQHVFNGLL